MSKTKVRHFIGNQQNVIRFRRLKQNLHDISRKMFQFFWTNDNDHQACGLTIKDWTLSTNATSVFRCKNDVIELSNLKKTMRSISEYWRLFWQNLTIEPVVFFYLMSVGLISVIRPTLLLDKACRIKLNFTEEICDDLEKYNKTEEVQKEVHIGASQFWKTRNFLSTQKYFVKSTL